MYDDLLPAIDGAALVLNSTLMYSARFAAEKLGVPQMAVALQPLVFLSSYDPPAVDQMPWLAPVLAKLGPSVTRGVYGLGKKAAARRGEPLYAFRRELGLPDAAPNPMFEGQFSTLGTLATYSPVLGAVQPDFPPSTTITGFTFYDQATRQRSALASDLQTFLADGPPPLVFTLGSFAVGFPGDFYRVSRDVARQLGQRAVLLVGAEGVDAYQDVRSDDVFVCDYAPFSELFSKARVIVHHGGVGTLGQALPGSRSSSCRSSAISSITRLARYDWAWRDRCGSRSTRRAGWRRRCLRSSTMRATARVPRLLAAK
jgi:UDP:flavonoid glycosyltransferase YjiC (YdhE family)